MNDPLMHSASTPEDRLQAIAAWGVDLSLTKRMLRRTPAERVAGVLEAADGFVQRSWLSRLVRPALHPVPPSQLFQRLIEAEVDFVLTEHLAEIAQGAPLLTDHAELCFRPDAENAARLARALLPLYPRLRTGIRRERSLRFFAQHGARLLLELAPLELDTQACRLCLASALPGVGAYPAIKQAATPLDLYGCQMCVLTLPALIARRQARGNLSDETFLPQLEAALLLATASAEAAPAGPR
jgi:hypothetical protein